MTFRKIAFHNIFRNKRIYAAYFLSSAFSVMIFFTYALLLFHPKLQGELTSTSETIGALSKMGMTISQILIFVFTFLFLLYSVGSFLKTRKKEFGILMIHGLSPKQQIRMIFTENLVIGLVSIAAGITVGVLFSKLILLISAHLLAIQNGLDFYFPLKAIGLTSLVYLVLFLLISLLSARMIKRNELLELLKADDKPKPEPKASKGLSILSALFILGGYGLVFYFAIGRNYSFLLLFLCVVFTVIGTYFLFTQLSVYLIGALKGRKRIFFQKTNMITLSELAYRMKDNATMFFMVAVISAVAFTGIGTTLALGNPGLKEMTNPYAFNYLSEPGNTKEAQHLTQIKNELKNAGFSYNIGSYSPKYADSGVMFLKLSDYNSLAKAIGYPEESLDNNSQTIVVPSTVTQKNNIDRSLSEDPKIQLLAGNLDIELQIIKTVPHVIMPFVQGLVVVVKDDLYNRIPFNEGETEEPRNFLFVVPNWEQTKVVANKLLNTINRADYTYIGKPLVLDWLESKQKNGIILIISVLVGIVFFTFAASFLYLRLFTDLERDRAQYQMIMKMGLSRKELGKIVTSQLTFMFFVPLLMALIHSTVAFIALQQLLDFSVFRESIAIFGSFTVIQIVYFLIARWRYMGHMVRKATES